MKNVNILKQSILNKVLECPTKNGASFNRQLMYKRNAELAKVGVVDLIDYKPKHITTRVAIFGREYEDSEICVIKDPKTGEEKEITIKELYERLMK